MRLLHFAHRGEAQTFIKRLNLKPINEKQNIYQKNDLLLCLSGEGPMEALNLVSFILGKYDITEVINLGIAGSLSPRVEKHKAYYIRSTYAHLGEKSQFHSFTSVQGGSFDCITSFERVLTDECAQKLGNFADIVDRELWGVAKACAYNNTPWISLKYISDKAGSLTNCFDLKAMALEFSNELYRTYNQLTTSEPVINEKESLALPFHASFTQTKRIEKLSSLLKLSSLETTDLAKEFNDAHSFINTLEDKVNPINAVIKKEIQKAATPFEKIGAQILINPKLDQRKIKLQMEINSQTNIENLIGCLRSFDFSKVEDLWDGKLDV